MEKTTPQLSLVEPVTTQAPVEALIRPLPVSVGPSLRFVDGLRAQLLSFGSTAANREAA